MSPWAQTLRAQPASNLNSTRTRTEKCTSCSLSPRRKLCHHIPLKADEPMQLAFQDALLIAMGTETFRCILYQRPGQCHNTARPWPAGRPCQLRRYSSLATPRLVVPPDRCLNSPERLGSKPGRRRPAAHRAAQTDRRPNGSSIALRRLSNTVPGSSSGRMRTSSCALASDGMTLKRYPPATMVGDAVACRSAAFAGSLAWKYRSISTLSAGPGRRDTAAPGSRGHLRKPGEVGCASFR